jgi:hypothetical protein
MIFFYWVEIFPKFEDKILRKYFRHKKSFVKSIPGQSDWTGWDSLPSRASVETA